MGLILGLDIGIATVGYGLIDTDEKKVIAAGTRIFPSADVANNLTRRTIRGSKRLLRRRRHRLDRGKYLLESKGIYKNTQDVSKNPYELRCKGLYEQLTKEELCKALLHIMKRRGISYIDDIDEEIKNSGNLGEVQEILKNKYVCEMQLEQLEKYNKSLDYKERVRGITNALIPTSAYEKECRALLIKQREFHKEITDEFIEEFISILKSKREYFVGPGNETNRTDYGIYRTNGVTLKNLFEILVGKCTVYKEEYRAPRFSYTAQLFNILNDLNNITVDNEKLDYNQKKQIIDIVLSSKSVNMMKIISKVTGKQQELISGYRINKENKPDFHNFSSYRYVIGKLKEEGEDISSIDIESYDKISRVLTLETDKSRKKSELKEKVDGLSNNSIEILSSINNSYFDGWHSLSIKAMNEVMAELFETSMNQMEIFTERGMLKNDLDKYKGKKNVPENIVDTEILSPVAKRSIRQSLKIVNRIRELYGELDSVVIEMAREVTTDAKTIQKEQRNNEKEKEAALNKALKECNFNEDSLSYAQKLKIRLWNQQEGKCIYSHKTIKITDLLYNNEMFDIDHIIPKSISFDDSLGNKVLCYSHENREKGNSTPFKYLISGRGKISYDVFKEFVLLLNKSNKISNKKKDLLLFEEDIQKLDVVKGFINRNLVDTRYATKVVLNTLQDYYKANNFGTKVYTIKGSLTNNIRRKWNVKKDRNEFKNHAEDAIIIASSKLVKLYGYNIFEYADNISKEKYRLDKIVDDEEFDSTIYTPSIEGLVAQIKNFPYKYSHKVDTKVNRQIADQTLYSTREYDGEDYIIEKYKDIYGIEGEKLKKRIIEKPETLLVFKNDIKTFELLQRVVEEYPKEKNPFLKYKEEYGIGLQKYSKKNKGPLLIKSIKYVSKKLGSCMDITHKYGKDEVTEKTSNKKRVVSLTLKPLRIDIYKCGDTYKFAGVFYKDFKYENGEYILDLDRYNKELSQKGIDGSFTFLFSVNKNTRINMIYGNVEEKWILTSIYNNNQNMIEVKPVDIKESEDNKRIARSFGKKVNNINKIVVDILGNEYVIEKEELKLKF